MRPLSRSTLAALLTLAVPAFAFGTDILRDTFGYRAADLAVPADELLQGCAERDCIPSIDAPRFVPAAEAAHVRGDALVLAVQIDGDARAYPTLILDQHEIVNDRFGDRPVAVTWCPLCGSGLAFERRVDGQEVMFGVSGLLHQSDLVMYDRSSNSLWQQITGEAIAGPHRGKRLQAIPTGVVPFAEWRAAHPRGHVLAPVPGRNYAADPYADYVASDRLVFPVTREDARLGRKRVVHGIETPAGPVAVEDRHLSEQQRVQVGLRNGATLVVEQADDGSVVASLEGRRLPAHRMFWFAWYSFHPGTVLVPASD